MIQFKRGKTASWRTNPIPLAAGQPGYDNEKNKIKIGNGTKSWAELPYVSGLSAEEILFSESDAKKRHKLDSEDKTLITYGTESPDKNTVGQLYLQYYDALPEVDYVISTGGNSDGGWSYQKWASGITRCFGTFTFDTAIQTALGSSSLYQNSSDMARIDYPFTFKEIPTENVTIQSPGGFVWVAAAKNGSNTTKRSAVYNLVSPDKLSNATYKISLSVEGYCK